MPEAAEPDLRVATFNIRTGWAFDRCRSWPFRKRAVLSTVEALDADVLALQEVRPFQLRWLRHHLRDHEVVAAGRDGAGRGEACPIALRRTAARLVEHRTIWFGDGPQRPGLRMEGARSPRIATTCRLQLVRCGAELEITNTHLDATSEERRHRSVDQLLAQRDRAVPHLVVGDLNATPGSRTVGAFAAAGYRDALDGTPGGTFHRFTGRTDGPRIDHVLVGAGIEVVDAAIVHTSTGRRVASDHWPVVAAIRLTSR